MTAHGDDVLAQSIIGLEAKILQSSDPTLQGIAGTVVFETRNTIFIRKNSITRQIAKNVAKKLEIKTSCCACFISGSALIGRAEDRISRIKSGDMTNYG
jgi:ribonuclease P protein subunit POP4